MCHACTISQSIKRTRIRPLDSVLSAKNQLFHSCSDWFAYTDSGPLEPKTIQYFSQPGLPTDATPRTRSVLGGPSPRRGNASGSRRTVEAHGTHVARRARTAPPRPSSTPPTSTRSFVSRRCKSRRCPRCRTGLYCGQLIVLEASQLPVMKVYIYTYIDN